MIAFLDASVVIYAVEGQPAWAEALKQQLRRLADELECRVGPLRCRPPVAFSSLALL